MTLGSESVLGTFSKRTLERLGQLGWDNSGTCDIAEYVLELEANGFPVNEAAKEALRRFGGKEFHFSGGGINWVRFEVREARHTFVSDHICILASLLGENACPIGGGAGYIVFVCPSGKAALLHEQWWFLMSCDSLAGLFEAIIFGDRSICTELPDTELYRPD
jgi:hypothetical protein